MPLINATDRWFYLDADGGLVEGDENPPPEARSILVAPGGSLDDATARSHGLADRLKASSDVTLRNSWSGEEVVHRGNRAYAASLVTATPPATRIVTRNPVVVEAKGSEAEAAESKMVEGPAENKSLGGPAPTTPATMTTPPAPAPRAARDADKGR